MSEQTPQPLATIEAECPACDGVGQWRVHDGSEEGGAEPCNLCGGRGEIEVKTRAIATLTARCEALEQELADSRLNHIDANQRNMACEERCEALTAERDHLQIEHDCHEGEKRIYKERIADLRSRCQHLEQADRERFNRDLQNYSSGYTQALDDALKGKP